MLPERPLAANLGAKKMSDIHKDQQIGTVERRATGSPKASLTTIDRDAPIRLETAANIAFPDGSVTVSTLRKQIKSGRLKAWEIGGKHFTSPR